MIKYGLKLKGIRKIVNLTKQAENKGMVCYIYYYIDSNELFALVSNPSIRWEKFYNFVCATNYKMNGQQIYDAVKDYIDFKKML